MLAEKIEAISPEVTLSTVFDVAAPQEGRVSITPMVARRILAEHNYSRQRPVRAPHVSFLVDEMRRGNFVSGTQIAFARRNNTLVLVNGQHRLTAQALSEATMEYQVLIQEAVDDEDIARFYYRQDRGGRARSDAEVLAAIGVAEKHGLTATVARSVFQAIPLIENKFQRPSIHTDPTLRNDDLRLDACRPWWPFAESFEYIIKAAPRLVYKKLSSSQAMAVALVTMRYQPERARVFWEGVSKDDGLRRSDPRKALLIDFGNREWARKSSEGAVVTSIAWNAFFSGRELTQIKVHATTPVRILGTPYDGKVR